MLVKKKSFNGDLVFTSLLAIYLSLLPIETVLTFGKIGSFHKYLGILLIIMSLFRNGSKIQIKCKPMIVFGVLTLFSTIWSVAVDTTFAYSTTILTFVAFNLFMEQRTYTIEEYNLIKYSIIAVGLFLAINVALGTGITYVSAGRTTIGTGNNLKVDWNNLALGLSFSNILLLIEIQKSEKKILRYVFCIAGCLLITYATFLTGSRGGLLCFLASATMFILYMIRYSHIGLKIFVIAIGAFLIFKMDFLLSFIPADMLTRFTIENIQSNGGSGRLYVWTAALEEYLNMNPFRQLLGVGYGAFPKFATMNLGFRNAAHNDYIQVILELGVVGLITVLTLFISEIKSSIKNKNIVALAIMVLVIVGSVSMETIFKKVTWGALLIAYVARTAMINE